jgi:hypothetical protein
MFSLGKVDAADRQQQGISLWREMSQLYSGSSIWALTDDGGKLLA